MLFALFYETDILRSPVQWAVGSQRLPRISSHDPFDYLLRHIQTEQFPDRRKNRNYNQAVRVYFKKDGDIIFGYPDLHNSIYETSQLYLSPACIQKKGEKDPAGH